MKIDPSQIAGLVRSLGALIAMLEECKRKAYETRGIKERAIGIEPTTFSLEGLHPWEYHYPNESEKYYKTSGLRNRNPTEFTLCSY